MFDFVDFFSSSANIFATGTSLFNSYANLRAGRERTQQQIREQQHLIANQRENIRFDKERLRENLAEYSAISSYQIDMLRQEQLHQRQQLGFNILASGVGITNTDSAGLLLRHQAYCDEMKARSFEAQIYYNRPRSNLNQKLAESNIKALGDNVRNIRSAHPWRQMGTVVGGVRDLMSIHSMSQ